MQTNGTASDLVDLEGGVISREIFVNESIYRQELENVFTRAWLFVGHESQIPNPGDFYTSRMGEESVILVRDKANTIHVFLNSCRHRGMKVCRYDSGNTSLFTCPYHSWTYTTDGKIRGIPLYKALYDGVLDREQWSLIEVAKLANYKGTIWATWDPEAPDFETYLGDAKVHLDQALDCRDGRPGGSEVIGVHKWVFPANWKYAAENFLGDTYHNPSHRSVDLIGIGPSARHGVKGRRDNELEQAQHVWISYPAGHGVHSAVQPEDEAYVEQFRNDPEIEEYFRHCHEERKRRLGDAGAAPAVRRHDLPEHLLSRTPAARPLRLASAQPDRDGGVALLPRRRRRPGGGEGLPASLLHALLRPRGHDRAGRPGELALRHQGQHGDGGAPLRLQLPAVDERRPARPHGQRPAGEGRGLHPDHRAHGAGLLPALGRLHGQGQLGRADGARRRPLQPCRGSRVSR